MVDTDNYVVINGVRFKDVTNQTTAGPIYTYEEADALTRGKVIATSIGNKKRNQTD